MGHSKGKITKPVNTDDVGAVLGLNSHDVAYLCSDGNGQAKKINPASKCKPIRFDKPSSLSDDDRLGSSSDKLDGIYYGLKIATNGPLYYLHDYNYEYQRVRAGTDWARLDDFVGYDHNAVFNPMGTINEVAVKESGIPVDINYSTNPSGTGVDVAELLSQISPDAEPFENMYPCALVTRGSKRYVRALWCMKYDLTQLSQKTGFCKMMDGGGWQNSWLILTNDLPDIAAGDTLTVTVFFIKYIYGVQIQNQDFRSWVQVTSQLVNGWRGITCPGAVAKSVSVTTNNPPAGRITAVMLSNKKANVVGSWYTAPSQKPIAGREYMIVINIKPEGGGTITNSHTVTAPDIPDNSTSLWPLNYTFDTGLLAGTEAISCFVSWYINSSGVTVNSGSFTVVLPKA